MPARVAVIVKGYPRLSEAFIAQELAGLERRGMALHIVSLRQPTDDARHPVHDEIAAPVLYLPEYLHAAPRRVWRAWRAVRSLPGYVIALRAWLADFRRDLTRNRLRRFGQALVLAHELPAGIARLHAHFLHTPASVARYASLIAGLPWSCSAHAKDIWTTPEWEKREKLASLDWLVTCTQVGAAHLATLAPEPAKVELVYHGLDLARFPPPPRDGNDPPPPRDGSDPAAPVLILSVGRLVEKKGYGDLLAALALLPRALQWRFVHVGGGALAASLRRQAARDGVAARIDWLGPQPHDAVLAQYRRADLFVLASRVARDGDRDGLPNVLVEAQSQALACLSTTAGAVAELVESEATGLLVAPGDVTGLAKSLERLIRDPALRARLGDAGGRRVRTEFGFERNLARLADKFIGGTDAGLGRAASGVRPTATTGPTAAAEPVSCALPSMPR